MIPAKQILADFQFLGNRVANFKLETKITDLKNSKIVLYPEFDYNIIKYDSTDSLHFGIIEFSVKIKAKSGNTNIFKIDLIMEGVFEGIIAKLSKDKFIEMLELNGIVTLSQISRAYLVSVTSQSGINPPVKLPMINVIALREKKHTNINSPEQN